MVNDTDTVNVECPMRLRQKDPFIALFSHLVLHTFI